MYLCYDFLCLIQLFILKYQQTTSNSQRSLTKTNTTVNALVREYLTRLAVHEDRAKRAPVRDCAS
jgi:hypothetical protein